MKLTGKATPKLVTKEGAEGKLFQLVAWLTGMKNALKGYVCGGMYLPVINRASCYDEHVKLVILNSYVLVLQVAASMCDLPKNTKRVNSSVRPNSTRGLCM